MYFPGQPTGDLSTYLENELRKIAEEMGSAQPSFRLATSYAAPKKFGEGTIVLADGTSWNPGSGAGFYGYRGGAWRKLD